MKILMPPMPGARVEIPLGGDLNEAKRKWAEFECVKPPEESGLMGVVLTRYAKEIVPGKSARTRQENLRQIATFVRVSGQMTPDRITPQHIARYRDLRGQTAPVAANRELALLSHVFNMAREWGYAADNPVRGVRKNKERPRGYYADDEVWQAVRGAACQELLDAMDLSYLTGQRPADVMKLRWSDIRDGVVVPGKRMIDLVQNKTGKRLHIVVEDALAALLERIRARKVSGQTIIATKTGAPVGRGMRIRRFREAREAAARIAAAAGNETLAERIRAFEFRDIRPKAASETSLSHASALLGHTEQRITEQVYRRRGQVVRPIGFNSRTREDATRI